VKYGFIALSLVFVVSLSARTQAKEPRPSTLFCLGTTAKEFKFIDAAIKRAQLKASQLRPLVTSEQIADLRKSRNDAFDKTKSHEERSQAFHLNERLMKSVAEKAEAQGILQNNPDQDGFIKIEEVEYPTRNSEATSVEWVSTSFMPGSDDNGLPYIFMTVGRRVDRATPEEKRVGYSNEMGSTDVVTIDASSDKLPPFNYSVVGLPHLVRAKASKDLSDFQTVLDTVGMEIKGETSLSNVCNNSK
jgi:hypothetical protein